MNQLAPRKRELAVHKTIHPVVDALSYCARLVNGRPLSASIQEMREQYPERRENINALFGPLEELEAAMAGLPLDAQLAEALAPLHVEHYMSGITAEELARLLRG